MKQFLFLVIIGLVLFNLSHAQSYTADALVYSRPQINGTARSLGVGGAFSSVGADLSSLTSNPAGIGLYRGHELSVSAGLNFGRSDNKYLGNNFSQGNVSGLFNHAGIVWTRGIKTKNAWGATSSNTFSMAFGYARLADFNTKRYFTGTNTTTSLATSATNIVNSVGAFPSPDDYSADVYIAYLGYLINYDSVLGYYTTPVQLPVTQTGKVTTKGGMDEVNLTLAGNINDKWYIGAGLGIPLLRYNTTYDYTEQSTSDTSDFRSFNLRTQITESGFGINGKFGVVYRPVPWARFGAAYHTPSFMTIGEGFNSTLYSDFATFYSTPELQGQPFNYRLRLPMKGILGASFFFKQYGFFSVDYEFLNYAANRFTFINEFKSVSDAINADNKRTLTYGHNLRAGIEGAYKKIRLRAGYAFMSGSYKSSANVKPADIRNNITAGFGFRGKHLFLDLAYVYSLSQNTYSPYTDLNNLQPVAESRINRHSLVLGIGYKFGNVANN